MNIKTKFEKGNKIFKLRSEKQIKISTCPVCEGFGSFRSKDVKEDIRMKYLVSEEEDETASISGRSMCLKCKGTGKISEEQPSSEWEIEEGNFLILDTTVKVDEYGTNVIYSYYPPGNITCLEQINEDDCFSTAEEASKAAQKRNARTVYMIDFDNMTFVFEDFSQANNFCTNFMKNGAKAFCQLPETLGKDFPSIPEKFRDLLKVATQQGINIKIAEMSSIQIRRLPEYGGVKVMNLRNELGPHYIAVLFGQEELAKNPSEREDENANKEEETEDMAKLHSGCRFSEHPACQDCQDN